MTATQPTTAFSRTAPFQLGDLVIDPVARCIKNAEISHTIEPKVFDLLIYFCQQGDDIVTRDQLLHDIWQGRVVNDNSINRKIYQLRKELAILDKTSEYIETITKYGYRLTQPITALETTPVKAKNTALSQGKQILALLVIVVLPFMVYWLNLPPQHVAQPTLKQLTSLPGRESDAGLSPDGQFLLFSYSANENSHHLILQNIKTGEQQKLIDTKHHDIRAQWHPNGKQIAFIRIKTNGETRCSIYQLTLEPTGAQPRKLIDCAPAAIPSLTWGQAPNKLFFAERAAKTKPFLVYSLDTSTGNKQQLTLPMQQNNLKGDYFIRRNNSGNELTILRYLGSNKVNVSIYQSEPFELRHEFSLAAHITGIARHPLGQGFYFRQSRHIYKVDEKGNNQQAVFHLGSAFSGLQFSNDGQQLLLSKSEIDTDIWSQDITHSTAKAAVEIDSTRQDSRPRYANLSNAQVFLSDRSGKTEFWLKTENGDIRKLSNLDFDVGLPNFTWSPDDKQLLFEYQEQIYTLQVDTGELDVILDDTHLAYVTSWSSDGKGIYYSSTKSGDWQLWSFNLKDKSTKQLTFKGGYSGYDNPVDGLLYFSKYHQNGLFRLNEDGSESQIIESFSLLNWLNWRLVDNKVYYTKSPLQVRDVFRFDLALMNEVVVLKQEKGILHDYTIAADGSRVTFTRHTSQSGDVMALDGLQP
jgi:transcriptional activator of cad operon